MFQREKESRNRYGSPGRMFDPMRMRDPFQYSPDGDPVKPELEGFFLFML